MRDHRDVNRQELQKVFDDVFDQSILFHRFTAYVTADLHRPARPRPVPHGPGRPVTTILLP